MIPLVVVGAGGLSREILDLIDAVNLDRTRYGEPEYTVKAVLDRHEQLADYSTGTRYVMAIGNSHARAKASPVGYEPVTLVSPDAFVGSRTTIGAGSVVLPGAVISCDVTIGAHCLVYYGATIGHDARLEDYVSLYPGANIAGGTRLCERVTVGAGASVIQCLTVGAGTFVGSGAVVIRDLPPDVTAVGVPTRSC